MAQFAIDRDYSLVICPFNAFMHLLTIEEQRSALECVYDALRDGGQFVFDVFVPSFERICGTYGAFQYQEIEYDGHTHVFRSRTQRVDEIAQQIRVDDELYGPAGEQVYAQSHRLLLLPKRELELLAHRSPFEDWTVQSDFTEEPLEDGDNVQVWTFLKDRS